MSRNVKPGITFYRMDSGHILNKKVRLLCNEFNSDGYYIWNCLLDYAYLTWGYYFDARDKEQLELFASDYCRKKLNLINEVIGGCVRRGLFDKTVYDSFGILTSEMMQEIFVFATSDRRKKGSEFMMQQDWLLVNFDVLPVNIKILPGKNSKNPGKNPQTRQDKTKTKQERLAPLAPDHAPDHPDLKKGLPRKWNATPRPAFVAPSIDEVKAYFASTVGNPVNGAGNWPEDRCRNEAATMYDHYTANGWVQGKGKPIRDWQATCRNWIRKAQSGIFNPVAHKNGSPSPIHIPAPVLTKLQLQVNYFFDLFQEDRSKVTIISIEPEYYDIIKAAGLIDFSDEEIKDIRSTTVLHLGTQDTELNEYNLNKYMKKFGVIEFFKQHEKQGKETVFSLPEA